MLLLVVFVCGAVLMSLEILGRRVLSAAARLQKARALPYPLSDLAGQVLKHDDVDAAAPVLTDDFAPVETLRQQR